MERPPSRNKATIATARVIPIFLAAVVAYGCYVATGPLTIEYLLNPPSTKLPRRLGAGVAILTVYYFLAVFVAATWLRLLIVVWTDPGYIELGDTSYLSENEPAPGLEAFYEKDVFVCDVHGWPIWCDHCRNWKLDRAHHNQDVGRCTLKMDHFCPWVGGVVGERSYKFFIQFLFYGFMLTTFSTAILGVFVAERVHNGLGQNIQWLIALGLAGFFCIFTMGMVGNSIWMMFRNVTTIENLKVNTGTGYVAVLLPPALQGQELTGPPPPPKPVHLANGSPTNSQDSNWPLTSDLDDPTHTQYFLNLQQPRPQPRSALAERIWKGTITYPTHLPVDRPPLPAPQLRTFAILETLPGMNIWDLGSAWANFKSVFGTKPLDWFFPLRHSPCCDHTALTSSYPLGPDFEELLIEVGLVPRPATYPAVSRWSTFNKESDRKPAIQPRARRRRRRLDPGWQDGERPDGWIMEKEARRRRNQWRREASIRGQKHDMERSWPR